MEITVEIPNTFTRVMINQFLSQILTETNKPKADKIFIDMSKVTFMTPGGVAALFNICMWLQQSQEVSAVFLIPQKGESSFKNLEVMRYLEDCGFFKQFFGEETFYKDPKLRPTTLEARTVKVMDSYEWYTTTLKTWLQKCSNRNDQFTNIQVAVQEIFNNICDHSSEQIGCVFAQFYPAKNQIVIAISDFGYGIPSVMRKQFSEERDVDLLKKALVEGVSTKSTPRNRGAGLTNIIRSLTTSGIGCVHIFSNYGKITIKDKEVINELEMPSYYPGTFFEIEIDLRNENLYEAEEEEDFEW